MVQKLKNNEMKELPEGMKQYFEQNPGKLAEALESSKEEAARLLKQNDELMKRLSERTDSLRKVMEQDGVLDDVLKRQSELERNMDGVMERQKRIGDAARRDIEGVIERAYELRRNQQSKPGKGQKKDDGLPEQKSQGDKDEKGEPKDPSNPTNPAENPYDPQGGDKPRASDGAERDLDKSVWETGKQGKEHERAKSSSEDGKGTPARYAGVYKRFKENLAKKPDAVDTPGSGGGSTAPTPPSAPRSE